MDSLDSRSWALIMNERLVLQKGISDCGLLWQSTEGIGVLVNSFFLTPFPGNLVSLSLAAFAIAT